MFRLGPAKLHGVLLRTMTAGLQDIAQIAIGGSSAIARRSGFRAYYDRFSLASDSARRTVLADPRTAVWIEQVQTELAEKGLDLLSTPAWELFLRSFGKFSLAVAIIEDTSESVRIPVDKYGQISVPGTDFVLSVSSDPGSLVEVVFESTGTIRVNGSPIVPMRLTRFGPFQLAPVESALEPPPVDVHQPLAPSEIGKRDWIGPLSSAIELVRLHTPSWELASRFGSVIVPIRDERPEIHCSVSFSALPGAIFMSWCPAARVLAEAVVHESDHQQFYVLTRFIRLWAEPVNEQPAIYRSPWRDDPRPLDGQLRGASAFIRVGEFWEGLLSTVAEPSPDFSWIGARIVLVLRQSLDALTVVRKYGTPSALGCEFVMALEDRARGVLGRVSGYKEFVSWQRMALEKEAMHDATWRKRYGARGKDRIQIASSVLLSDGDIGCLTDSDQIRPASS